MSEELERGERLRRRKQRDQRPPMDRARWVQAAIAALGQHGPNALNIDHLAKGLNTTRGSIYSHFDDRHDLVLACAEHVLETDRNEDAKYIPADRTDSLRLLDELFDYAYADTLYQLAFFHLTRLDGGHRTRRHRRPDPSSTHQHLPTTTHRGRDRRRRSRPARPPHARRVRWAPQPRCRFAPTPSRRRLHRHREKALIPQ